MSGAAIVFARPRCQGNYVRHSVVLVSVESPLKIQGKNSIL